MEPLRLNAALTSLSDNGLSPAALILHLLGSRQPTNEDVVQDLISHVEEILEALSTHTVTKEISLEWARRVTTRECTQEVMKLVNKQTGWHFNANHATPEKMDAFQIPVMANLMRDLAPHLWDLLGALLSADHVAVRRRKAGVMVANLRHGTGDGSGDQVESEAEKLLSIKKVTCVTIMTQSTNQRCNPLPAVMGIFGRCSNTPERVMEVLAHAGLSISTTAVNNAIRSLAEESRRGLRALGSTMLASYAYDNFDVDLKVDTPTVEKAVPTLKHLTSGTLLEVKHGVTTEDLRCADTLWRSSPNNPQRESQRPVCSWDQLLTIHPEDPHPSGLYCQQRFNAWKMRYDLCHHGPEYFRQFIPQLGCPYKPMYQIPVVKTPQVPARAMNINQSTVQGNAEAVEDLLRQGGVGAEGVPNVVDVAEHIILFHGDLSTMERIQSLLASRSIEHTPFRQMRFMVFIPGLFHLKMACADAVWRTYLEPKRGQEDTATLMHYISISRYRQAHSIATKFKFRRTHEVIGHVGIALRLDGWETEIHKRFRLDTREQWADTKPLWEDVVKLSEDMAGNFVAGRDFEKMRRQRVEERDQVFENSLLMNRDFLLYEMMADAMNQGDIGAVEWACIPWIFIFKGSSKSKYAAQMTRFLHDVHFVYPERLRRAIRLNWLCNPTGKEGKFRGVDWLVERNNLYTKVVYGGSVSNRTVHRIILESPLVETYRSCIDNIQDNFLLSNRTIAHADTDLTKTLHALGVYMHDHDIHRVLNPGRKVTYLIPNQMSKGLALLNEGATQVDDIALDGVIGGGGEEDIEVDGDDLMD
ncbi:hypothetical protein JAAARDRAFT_195051 [Jaapia argillacea MUCL 33604]|uniref:DUF6589 domain-containing protein n=1 Tax=Jaapia argillacea MUCL 33604 TaxID=933084 RepID=A0A067Q1D7_9AGAM|nr:hypothetical protein JAAARDRAFT_195051 [Jaapia argillacea MUCL 33604]